MKSFVRTVYLLTPRWTQGRSLQIKEERSNLKIWKCYHQNCKLWNLPPQGLVMSGSVQKLKKGLVVVLEEQNLQGYDTHTVYNVDPPWIIHCLYDCQEGSRIFPLRTNWCVPFMDGLCLLPGQLGFVKAKADWYTLYQLFWYNNYVLCRLWRNISYNSEMYLVMIKE